MRRPERRVARGQQLVSRRTAVAQARGTRSAPTRFSPPSVPEEWEMKAVFESEGDAPTAPGNKAYTTQLLATLEYLHAICLRTWLSRLANSS